MPLHNVSFYKRNAIGSHDNPTVETKFNFSHVVSFAKFCRKMTCPCQLLRTTRFFKSRLQLYMREVLA